MEINFFQLLLQLIVLIAQVLLLLLLFSFLLLLLLFFLSLLSLLFFFLSLVNRVNNIFFYRTMNHRQMFLLNLIFIDGVL